MKKEKQLYAVTLWRPWPYAIMRLGKDYENRTWKCWLKPDSYLAIHAGKRWDESGAGWISGNFGVHVLPARLKHTEGAIVGIVRFGGNIKLDNSPWFSGPVGWRLYEPVPIDPVPCSGKQGLWVVEGDVLTAVRKNYKIAMEQLQKSPL